jgi:hypothetical protein
MTFETKISVEQEYRDPRYKNCQRFFNNLKKVSEKDLYKSYGLFIDNAAFHLVCNDPKVAFNPIKEENP